jgi:VanZ family protein
MPDTARVQPRRVSSRLAMSERLAFRFALAICVVAVSYLAFAPLREPVGFSWDKGNHVLAFFIMALLAHGGWPGRAHAPMRWGLLMGYGVGIEVIQQQLPLRHFSWLDIFADGLGLLLYAAVAALLTRAGVDIFGQAAGCRVRAPRILSRDRDPGGRREPH